MSFASIQCFCIRVSGAVHRMLSEPWPEKPGVIQ